MSTITPVDSITALLKQAGYRLLPTPLEIAGMKFNVTAALVGTGTLPDLIIVADTLTDPDERTRSKLEAIARALDTVKSRRPLTAVLTGPRPNSSVMEAISKICRVLPIGSSKPEEAEAAMKNWLAVLMPLDLPQPVEAIADPISELEAAVGYQDLFVNELIAVSEQGKDAVEALLHDRIAAPIQALDEEIEE
jgi:hypothetical protein